MSLIESESRLCCHDMESTSKASTGKAATYHVLLVGIDAYPPAYRSLYGCANDIDSIERLLLEMEGTRLLPVNLRITRLAAPHSDAVSSSRFQDQTLLPTKANIVLALQRILREARAEDRALIYYSGHGHYLKWAQASTWHEALVTCDVQFLYDIEVNRLINDIARRMDGDLTLALDCCHSSGAFRELTYNTDEEGRNERFLEAADPNTGVIQIGPPPDPALLRLGNLVELDRDAPNSMLRVSEPNYIVIAACQAVEAARERPMEDGDYHGLLTYALATTIGAVPPAERAALRWIDVWPQVLDQVERLGRIAPKSPQHPWLVGRPERLVFGGAWQRQDAGIPIHATPNGYFELGAGSLMGLTPEAEVAVYGAKPHQFPQIGSELDQRSRLGLLRVVEGGRARGKAEVVEGLDAGIGDGTYRGRLVKPGVAERLGVRLDPPDPLVARALHQSALLRVCGPGAGEAGEAEVWVKGDRETGWTIADEVTPEVARVPPSEVGALRAGLMHYARFNETLRLARRITALGYDNPLEISLLDCNDRVALNRMGDPHDPALPLLPGVNAASYILPTHTRFCIRIRNRYRAALYVNVFDCEAFGRVDHMGELTVRANDQQALWRNEEMSEPWVLLPSRQRREVRDTSTDRLVIVATTSSGIAFNYLATDLSVQEVVDLARDFRGVEDAKTPGPATPNELWVAHTIIVKIGGESGGTRYPTADQPVGG